jgi:hypothetical protein
MKGRKNLLLKFSGILFYAVAVLGLCLSLSAPKASAYPPIPDNLTMPNFGGNLDPTEVSWGWGGGTVTQLPSAIDGGAVPSDVRLTFGTAPNSIKVGSMYPFDKVQVFYSTPGVPTGPVPGSLTYKYWDGSNWVPLLGLIDPTLEFTAAPGVPYTISFNIPNNWQRTNLGTVNEPPSGLFYIKIDTINPYSTPAWGDWISVTNQTNNYANQVFYFDSTTGAWADHTPIANEFLGGLGIGFPLALSSATPLGDDATYIGLKDKFNHVFFELDPSAPPPAGGTLAWEYWNGKTWNSVSNLTAPYGGNKDLTGGITPDETYYLNYDMPNDWKKTAVEGVNAYYLRLRTTTAYTAPVMMDLISLYDGGKLPLNSSLPTVFGHKAESVQWYDSSTTTWNDQTLNSINRVEDGVFLGSNITNDQVCIGMEHPYDEVFFDISGSSLGAGVSSWSYYNGTWNPITPLVDNTSGFMTPGNIVFQIPNDWLKTNINGKNKYYFCATVVTPYTVLAPPHQNVAARTVEVKKAANAYSDPVWWYNGSTWSDQTGASADTLLNDVTLGGNIVGSKHCFGMKEKFRKLYYNVSTPGAGGMVNWTYWDGDNWLPVPGLIDNTASFSLSGLASVSFDLPLGWDKIQLNTDNYPGYYYVCAETTASYSPAALGSIVHTQELHPFSGGNRIASSVQFDNSGVFTDYTIPAANDILNDTQLSGSNLTDYLYIADTYKFDEIFFNITIPGVGGNVVWEYYSGTTSSWAPLGANVIDNTNGFINAGPNASVDINLDPNSGGVTDWVPTSVNGIHGFYIRAKVTAAYSTIPLATQVSIASERPFARTNAYINQIWHEAPVGNFFDVTHEAKEYNSIPGAYGDVSMPSGNGQALYIGQDYKFDTISVNVAQPGFGGTIQYEHWDMSTSSWKPLTVTDNTNGLTLSGQNVISFTPPDNWGSSSVNGSPSLYYIKIKNTVPWAVPATFSQLFAREYNLRVRVEDELGNVMSGLNNNNFNILNGSINSVIGFRNDSQTGTLGEYEFALPAEPADDNYDITVSVPGFVDPLPMATGNINSLTNLTATPLALSYDLKVNVNDELGNALTGVNVTHNGNGATMVSGNTYYFASTWPDGALGASLSGYVDLNTSTVDTDAAMVLTNNTSQTVVTLNLTTPCNTSGSIGPGGSTTCSGLDFGYAVGALEDELATPLAQAGTDTVAVFTDSSCTTPAALVAGPVFDTTSVQWYFAASAGTTYYVQYSKPGYVTRCEAAGISRSNDSSPQQLANFTAAGGDPLLYGLKVTVWDELNGNPSSVFNTLDTATYKAGAPSVINGNVYYWADTAGVPGALSLQEDGWVASETTNVGFGQVTTSSAVQTDITVTGQGATCSVTPVGPGTSTCKGMEYSYVVTSITSQIFNTELKDSASAVEVGDTSGGDSCTYDAGTALWYCPVLLSHSDQIMGGRVLQDGYVRRPRVLGTGTNRLSNLAPQVFDTIVNVKYAYVINSATTEALSTELINSLTNLSVGDSTGTNTCLYDSGTSSWYCQILLANSDGTMIGVPTLDGYVKQSYNLTTGANRVSHTSNQRTDTIQNIQYSYIVTNVYDELSNDITAGVTSLDLGQIFSMHSCSLSGGIWYCSVPLADSSSATWGHVKHPLYVEGDYPTVNGYTRTLNSDPQRAEQVTNVGYSYLVDQITTEIGSDITTSVTSLSLGQPGSVHSCTLNAGVWHCPVPLADSGSPLVGEVVLDGYVQKYYATANGYTRTSSTDPQRVEQIHNVQYSYIVNQITSEIFNVDITSQLISLNLGNPGQQPCTLSGSTWYCPVTLANSGVATSGKVTVDGYVEQLYPTSNGLTRTLHTDPQRAEQIGNIQYSYVITSATTEALSTELINNLSSLSVGDTVGTDGCLYDGGSSFWYCPVTLAHSAGPMIGVPVKDGYVQQGYSLVNNVPRINHNNPQVSDTIVNIQYAYVLTSATSEYIGTELKDTALAVQIGDPTGRDSCSYDGVTGYWYCPVVLANSNGPMEGNFRHDGYVEQPYPLTVGITRGSHNSPQVSETIQDVQYSYVLTSITSEVFNTELKDTGLALSVGDPSGTDTCTYSAVTGYWYCSTVLANSNGSMVGNFRHDGYVEQPYGLTGGVNRVNHTDSQVTDTIGSVRYGYIINSATTEQHSIELINTLNNLIVGDSTGQNNCMYDGVGAWYCPVLLANSSGPMVGIPTQEGYVEMPYPLIPGMTRTLHTAPQRIEAIQNILYGYVINSVQTEYLNNELVSSLTNLTLGDGTGEDTCLYDGVTSAWYCPVVLSNSDGTMVGTPTQDGYVSQSYNLNTGNNRNLNTDPQYLDSISNVLYSYKITSILSEALDWQLKDTATNVKVGDSTALDTCTYHAATGYWYCPVQLANSDGSVVGEVHHQGYVVDNYPTSYGYTRTAHTDSQQVEEIHGVLYSYKIIGINAEATGDPLASMTISLSVGDSSGKDNCAYDLVSGNWFCPLRVGYSSGTMVGHPQIDGWVEKDYALAGGANRNNTTDAQVVDTILNVEYSYIVNQITTEIGQDITNVTNALGLGNPSQHSCSFVGSTWYCPVILADSSVSPMLGDVQADGYVQQLYNAVNGFTRALHTDPQRVEQISNVLYAYKINTVTTEANAIELVNTLSNLTVGDSSGETGCIYDPPTLAWYCSTPLNQSDGTLSGTPTHDGFVAQSYPLINGLTRLAHSDPQRLDGIANVLYSYVINQVTTEAINDDITTAVNTLTAGQPAGTMYPCNLVGGSWYCAIMLADSASPIFGNVLLDGYIKMDYVSVNGFVRNNHSDSQKIEQIDSILYSYVIDGLYSEVFNDQLVDQAMSLEVGDPSGKDACKYDNSTNSWYCPTILAHSGGTMLGRPIVDGYVEEDLALSSGINRTAHTSPQIVDDIYNLVFAYTINSITSEIFGNELVDLASGLELGNNLGKETCQFDGTNTWYCATPLAWSNPAPFGRPEIDGYVKQDYNTDNGYVRNNHTDAQQNDTLSDILYGNVVYVRSASQPALPLANATVSIGGTAGNPYTYTACTEDPGTGNHYCSMPLLPHTETGIKAEKLGWDTNTAYNFPMDRASHADGQQQQTVLMEYSAIDNFRIVTTEDTRIKVAWKPSPDPDFDHYEIYYDDNVSKTNHKIGDAYGPTEYPPLSTAATDNSWVEPLWSGNQYALIIHGYDIWNNITRISKVLIGYTSGGGIPPYLMNEMTGGTGADFMIATEVQINEGDQSTDDLNVEINLEVSDANDIEYKIANNEDDLIVKQWVDMQSEKVDVPWHLESGDKGIRHVYILFRHNQVKTMLDTDDIYYEPGPQQQPPPSEAGAGFEIPSDIESVTQPPSGVSYGDLIKTVDKSTVYYYGYDGRRHVFPSETEYFSWFSDWSDIKIISSNEMADIPLGKNVMVRPGTYLVKIQSGPKVYAVEPNGVIRWIKTEKVAKDLYGKNWSDKVVDINPAYFVDYVKGDAITESVYPQGSIFQYVGDSKLYYVDEGKREVTDNGFSSNGFRLEFVNSALESVTLPNAASLDSAEFEIVTIY